jgi:hypothetical protein
MTDRTFNFIRFLAEIGITAIGTFYKVIAEIWDLPYGEAVLATCVALSTLIGVFVEYNRAQYNKAKLAHVADASPILPEDLTVEVKKEDIE